MDDGEAGSGDIGAASCLSGDGWVILKNQSL